MGLLMVIGILLVLVLIRLIFGKNDFTSELIRGISKKLGKKVLIFGVVGGVALLIFIQMEKKSHEAYRESIQEQQQYDIEQYEKMKLNNLGEQSTLLQQNSGKNGY